MRRVLNAINASISETVDMLLKISRIPIWIMSIICGFVSERRCVTVLGGVAGLDYGAAIKTFETLGYEITPYDFMGLQTLEMDFLCEQSEKSEKKD